MMYNIDNKAHSQHTLFYSIFFLKMIDQDYQVLLSAMSPTKAKAAIISQTRFIAEQIKGSNAQPA